jgi:hypothetical protein
MFEILIKDSYKRTKRHSRSSSQAPVAPSTSSPGEARFARLIHQHRQQLQQQRQDHGLLGTRNAVEQEQGRDITVDGTRYRINRSGSPMDMANVDRESRPTSIFVEEATATATAVVLREEDKEEEGTVENRETGLGTVVFA